MFYLKTKILKLNQIGFKFEFKLQYIKLTYKIKLKLVKLNFWL